MDKTREKASESTPWVDRPLFQNTIIVLIVLNAAILGFETVPSVMSSYGSYLLVIDKIILGIFVIELILRAATHRLAFFKDPWSLFDFLVVVIALVPASGPFSVLRALRVLRVLRLLTMVPSMRRVVGALLGSIPGLSSIALVLLILFYVFAVIATNLYAASFPEWFGSIGDSLYTLFQIMTLESWSMGIVRPVMEVHPSAWMFFVVFILIATFTMLNLFIAIIVNAMQSFTDEDDKNRAVTATDMDALKDEIRSLRDDVGQLKALLADRGDRSRTPHS